MLIVFDLDGTLIDSAQDLAISMNATRKHLSLPPLDAKLIGSYVGNGAALLVRRALPPDASDELNAQALAYFLKYYRAHALEHTRLYDGVKQAVEQLAAEGHTLAVLTNKPVKISRDIVDGLGIGSSFKRVYGGNSFPTKKPDPQGLLSLLSETGTGRDDAWMVGDSEVDIQTARNAGVRSCGVMWGFRPDTCAAENPDVMIESAAQLLRFFNAEAMSLREPT